MTHHLPSIDRLLKIMETLRGPGGCPWDREQTHQSIRKDLVEECYELCDAIDSLDDQSLREELGDLLLQVVFHSQLARERGAFDFEQVAAGIAEKLIHRHPHVFGDATAKDSETVLRQWEEIKAREFAAGKKSEKRESALDGVPRSMPTMPKAQKVLKKAAKVGFTWRNRQEAWIKFQEEVGELHRALEQETPQRVADEIGDTLFTLVNLARLEGLEADELLHRAVVRFEGRFRVLENHLRHQGKAWGEHTLEELNTLFRQLR